MSTASRTMTALEAGFRATKTREPENLGPMVLAVCWTETGVAAMFLGLRLYIKLTAHRRLLWDDFLLVGSWLFLLAFAGSAVHGVSFGLGLHQAKFNYGDNGDTLQLTVVIATVFSVLGAALSKTSFAITLLRLTKGLIHQVVWFVIISMNIVLVFNAILQFVWCQPASVAWQGGAGGTCWSKDTIVYYSVAAAAYSASMDILLAMVPWSVILSLNMHMREKIGVAVCMSLGIVAAITSIMRAVYVPSIYSDDYTWDESPLFVWTATELAITIVAASIPVLRPLLSSFVRSMHQREGKTRVTNTFKTGTYARGAYDRTQSYQRMDGDTISPKFSGGAHPGGINKDVYRVTASTRSFEYNQNHGGVAKTEEVQVQYARTSINANELGHAENSALGFELEEVKPSYFRSKPR